MTLGRRNKCMIIYNNTIVFLLTSLFGRFYGITLFPFIFLKREKKGDVRCINHERIHLCQQAECLLVFFLLIYFNHYLLLRLFKKMDHMTAYRNICFEKEAYAHEKDLKYLKSRKFFAWMR
jgi:hypothetical protein